MIVRLPQFGWFRQGSGPQSFRGPAQLRACWEGLRQGGGIPERASLDPRGLAGVLDRVFLAERIGRGIVQVHIAGSALSEAAGTDLRGLPLSCLFLPEARPELAKVLEEVAMAKAISELDLSVGGAQPVARMVLLPVADGPDRRLVLGCLGFEDGQFSPRRGLAILRRQDEGLSLHSSPSQAPVVPRPVRLRLVHSAE